MIDDMNSYSLEAWKGKGQYYNWKGHQIFTIEAPHDKPTLLLIHGFPTASFDWHKIWDQLAEHYQLISLDLLGFGFSDKPNDIKYPIALQADLIEALLESKGIDKIHLLAHDYGDTVAQELMARYNEQTTVLNIQSVCLLNGGIFPEAHRALLIQKLLMGPLGVVISRLLNKQKFAKSFGKIFGKDSQLSEEEMGEYWQLVSYKNGHRIAHLIAQYRRERIDHRTRWVEALQNFNNPLRLINGPDDPISGIQMVDRYKELITDPRVDVLEGIGHYPQVEAPELLLDLLIGERIE